MCAPIPQKSQHWGCLHAARVMERTWISANLEANHIDPNCCDIGTSPSNDLHPKQSFDLLESFPAPVHLNHIVIHSNPLSTCHGESFSCRSLNLGGTFLVKFQVAQWNWSSLLELKRWQIQSDSFYICYYCGQIGYDWSVWNPPTSTQPISDTLQYGLSSQNWRTFGRPSGTIRCAWWASASTKHGDGGDDDYDFDYD